MATKKLRSLILENFPQELRVEIDLLSRRRDLINREKQEELFKLLRKYNINDITPLGAGTNRYAFRYQGFVIKVATDRDGTIDNQKEFLMAPKLYPYVTKVYEISGDSLLLVAEYIQPFMSYAEMLQYQDKIRAILTKLSSVYLIGDVGITSKNYANWGVRIGDTSEPVCLDFAYVYEVSSELFVCSNCNTNSVLVPNKDFTKLICPNPACGKEYTFEEIRMKISREMHAKEIGDLGDVGYQLTESGVNTELDEVRSPYLIKETKSKKKVKKVAEEQPVELINFIYDEKEDKSMAQVNLTKMTEMLGDQPVVPGKVVAVEPNGEGVAFSGEIGGPVIQGIVVNTEEAEPEPSVAEMNETHQFSDQFMNNLGRAVSIISNKIRDDIHSRDVFNEVRGEIQKKKEMAEPFYTAVGNAVFRSLVSYLGMHEVNVPNSGSSGSHREWLMDSDPSNDVVGTLHFLERVWNTQSLNRAKSATELMYRYKHTYGDYQGIDPQWKSVFVNRLTSKYPISVSGANTIADEIGSVWCHDNDEDFKGYDEEDNPTESDDDYIGDDYLPVDYDETVDDDVIIQTPEEENDVVFAEAITDPDEAEEVHPEDLVGDESAPTRVDIVRDFDGAGPNDVHILITSCDYWNDIHIPIYINLNEEASRTMYYGSELNQYNEWLVHMVPDYLFTTKTPEKWMERYNIEESTLTMVVLATPETRDDELYLMGAYLYDGMFDVDGNRITDPEILSKINTIIIREIGTTSISYYYENINSTDYIHTEDDMTDIEEEAGATITTEMEDDDEDEDDEDRVDIYTPDMMDFYKDDSDDEPETVEETVEESEPDVEEVEEESVEDEHPLTEAEQAALEALGVAPTDTEADPEETESVTDSYEEQDETIYDDGPDTFERIPKRHKKFDGDEEHVTYKPVRRSDYTE